MIELVGLVATVLAVIGVVLNNRKRRACFLIWIVSNLMTAAIHAHAGIWQGADCKTMILRDLVFVYLAVEGWQLWGRKKL